MKKEIFNFKKDLFLIKENVKLSYLKVFNINNEILINDLLKLSNKYNFKIENEINNNIELRKNYKNLYNYIISL